MTDLVVSVLIDTHNHEKYIEQAMVSAVEQDFPASDCEIVVVDDGSTDRTPDIVRKFAPRVRLLRKKNGGQASAFNAAVPELRGELVAFLDGDDWWAREKLAAVAAAFAEHPEAAAVGHGYYEVQEDAGAAKLHALERSESSDLSNCEAALGALRAWDFLRTSAFTARKTVLETILPVPEALVFCADAFIAPACMVTGVHVIQQPLLYYRVHGENLCTFEGAANEARLPRRCEMHELLFELLEPMLIKMGVRRNVAWRLLYPYFTDLMRFKLKTFGGSRLNAFRTEMRAFAAEHASPSRRYRLFKHTAVGAATLLLPPRAFYRAKDWYASKNLGRLRERLAKSA
ncbi:MAG: glycosyltransferase family A protein [Candidatus Acidiferrales bacterium]